MKEKAYLVDLFCRGNSKKFAKEGRCHNFEVLTGDCRLLQRKTPLGVCRTFQASYDIMA